MVLAVCDRAVGGNHPLSYLVGSLIPVLEGTLVVVVVAFVLMGSPLPESVAIGGVSPASILVVVAWLVGIYVINRVRHHEPWRVTMPGSSGGRRSRRLPHPTATKPFERASTLRVGLLFLGASAVTLVAGAALQVSGSALADGVGWTA